MIRQKMKLSGASIEPYTKSSKIPFAFQITNGRQSMLAAAISQEELDAWLLVLRHNSFPTIVILKFFFKAKNYVFLKIIFHRNTMPTHQPPLSSSPRSKSPPPKRIFHNLFVCFENTEIQTENHSFSTDSNRRHDHWLHRRSTTSVSIIARHSCND